MTRKDQNRHGGGVLAYVPVSMKAVRRHDLESDSVEILWLELKPNKDRKVLMAVIYRPPGCGAPDFFQIIATGIEKSLLENKEVTLIGDLNCNMLTCNPLSDKLQQLLDDYGFTQLITEPTRITSDSQTLIDVIATTHPENYGSRGVISCGVSDHMLVYAEQMICANPPVGTITTRCFNKCDWEVLQEDMMAAPWQKVEKCDNADQAWNSWKSIFLEVLNKHAPVKTVRPRKNQLPWIDEDIRELMQERDWVLHKYHRTKDRELWNVFKRMRNQVTMNMRRAKREYYAAVCNDIKNPKKGWTALRSLMGKHHKEPIQAIMTEDGEVTGDQQIAEVFNKYFTSLFTSRTSVCDLLPEENECETGFKFRKLTFEDTQKELKSLDKNKATGLDGISAKCLRITASAIAGSLNHVFNLSLASGEIPQEWKNAKVTPIFKAGNKMNIKNYRPISVLPVVVKVFERLVYAQLYSFLLERHLLTGSQSGFRPGHSAQDLVLKVVDD